MKHRQETPDRLDVVKRELRIKLDQTLARRQLLYRRYGTWEHPDLDQLLRVVNGYTFALNAIRNEEDRIENLKSAPGIQSRLDV